MENILSDALRQEFHSLNNWLSKITTLSGVARHHLETNGIDLEKLEEEKEKLIKVLNELEDYALKIGDILKRVNKSVEVG